MIIFNHSNVAGLQAAAFCLAILLRSLIGNLMSILRRFDRDLVPVWCVRWSRSCPIYITSFLCVIAHAVTHLGSTAPCLVPNSRMELGTRSGYPDPIWASTKYSSSPIWLLAGFLVNFLSQRFIIWKSAVIKFYGYWVCKSLKRKKCLVLTTTVFMRWIISTPQLR